MDTRSDIVLLILIYGIGMLGSVYPIPISIPYSRFKRAAGGEGARRDANLEEIEARNVNPSLKALQWSLRTNNRPVSHNCPIAYEFDELNVDKPQMTTKAAPQFVNPHCIEEKGRTVCHLGRYTYIINRGELVLDSPALERFVGMMYHRTQEGDKCFDISVDAPETPETPVACPAQSEPCPKKSPAPKLSPVTIECTPVAYNQKPHASNSSDEKNSEVVFKCTWSQCKNTNINNDNNNPRWETAQPNVREK